MRWGNRLLAGVAVVIAVTFAGAARAEDTIKVAYDFR